jgi:hypothetical protein
MQSAEFPCLAVYFGSVSAAFTVLSDSVLVATAPPQAAAGTIDVTVTTPSGTSSTGSADHVIYNAAAAPTVTSVTPNSGSSIGGATVTVIATDFTGASAVNFGSTAATWDQVLSDTALLAQAPAGTAGTLDISVISPSGTSRTDSAAHFTFNTTAVPASLNNRA